MSKYHYTDRCRELTGRGGIYEESCRAMVIRGMEWLDEQTEATRQRLEKKPQPKGTVVIEDLDENELLRVMLAECIMATQGMLKLSFNHLFYAAEVGWPNYIKELENDHGEDTKNNN